MNPQRITRVGTAMRQPVFGTQAVFRVLLDALSRPGRIATLPELGLAGIEAPVGADGRALPVGLVALLLALLDRETSVRLHGACASEEVRAYLRFHTGVVQRDAAAFEVLHARDLDPPRCASFELGSDEQPERGATVLLLVDAFDGPGSTQLSLQGPGVDGVQALRVAGLSADFWSWRRQRQADYPRGVELVFIAGQRVAALPRSTRIVEIG